MMTILVSLFVVSSGGAFSPVVDGKDSTGMVTSFESLFISRGSQVNLNKVSRKDSGGGEVK